MANFKYKVRDNYGRPLAGEMSADNKEAVLAYIKKMGYTPVVIEESGDVSGGKDFFAKFVKVKQEDIIIFTRQLVTLQSAGLPLLMSLAAIKEQTESNVLKEEITKISKDIESGCSFSEALSKYPSTFSELYVNMVRAGEASGLLDEVLERLANLGEQQMQTNAKIKSATMYPIIVIATLFVAFGVVVTFVLPRFANLFNSFNVQLPMPTRILLCANYVVRNWWYLLILLAATAVFLFTKYINTRQGRIIWDGFKLRVPIFGPLVLKIVMSRFTRISSALIRSGIPLLQVLDMSSKTAGNVIVGAALLSIKKSVNEGKPMNEAMRSNKLFPPIVTQMVAIGESTGRLEQLLLHISDYYDAQVDHSLKNLTTTIEPVLIFCLGGMVLLMALGIFLPMWNMIQVFKR